MRGCGTPARPPAYVGAPALLVIVGIHLRNELPAGEATEPSVKVGWSVAVLSYPPLAVGQFDSPEKTETYWIFRDPEGGRTDDFAGRRKAKSLLQNSKSIARWRIEPIGGRPSLKSPHEWSLRALHSRRHIGRVGGLGERCGKNPRLRGII